MRVGPDRHDHVVGVPEGCRVGGGRELSRGGSDAAQRAVQRGERRASLKAEEALASSQQTDTLFDVIWSNPPVRIGKDAMHEMLLAWLGRLAPTGVAYLVVQRNLGADSLIGWLNGRGFQASKFASKKGFRIIEVRPA